MVAFQETEGSESLALALAEPEEQALLAPVTRDMNWAAVHAMSRRNPLHPHPRDLGRSCVS